MLDIPKYKTHPKPERFLITKILVLIVLGALLYLGIYVNYWLLQTQIPEIVNWIFIASIIMLLIMEAILCYVRYGNYNYVFYDTRIEINEYDSKNVKYEDVLSLSYEQKLLDKWMKTGTIILKMKNSDKPVKLKHLINSNQIYFFIQKYMETEK